MRTKLFVLVLVSFPILFLLTGCAAMFSLGANQYVDVLNTMPGTYINVIGSSGVYGKEAFGKALGEGESCRVSAALFPDSQTLTVIVNAYDSSGRYIGSRSQSFTFCNPRGSHYRNQRWDVRRTDFPRN